MKTWLLIIIFLGNLPAFAGMNMIVDDINVDSVDVDIRRQGVLRFNDNSGNLFFIRCENYTFSKSMTFSSFRSQITTSGNGCNSLLENIKLDLDAGNKLHSLEVQIISDRNHSKQMYVQPHYR